jgi:WD40 repeat protein
LEKLKYHVHFFCSFHSLVQWTPPIIALYTATTFLKTAPLLWFAGDDNGLIKTWDQRQPESTASFEAHTDFVSDMVLHEREQCLVAVSGDGTLTVNDLRTNKV